jgi:AraC-like DNA-binding protein
MSYWTYRDLADEFGLSPRGVQRRMKEWAADGFPAPLPWSRRDKRWDAESVRRWKARRELRAQSVLPELKVAS